MGIFHVKPAPPGDPNNIPIVPEVTSNIVSRALFSWVFPLLRIGYSRPLEKDDLYVMDEPRQAANTATLLERYFYERVPPSRRPRHLQQELALVDQTKNRKSSTKGKESEKHTDDSTKEEASSEVEGLPTPATTAASSKPEKTAAEVKAEEKLKKKYPGGPEGGKVLVDGIVYDQNLAIALANTFFWPFWGSAVFMFLSSLLQILSPLVTKKLIAFLATSYAYAKLPEAAKDTIHAPKDIGYGIGLAIGLFAMQEAASLFQNQYMQLGMTNGFLMRSTLTANVSRKSVRLSGAARVKNSSGHLTTLISSDTAFLDWAGWVVHMIWIQPIIIAIGMGLLIGQLGYSALVGLALLLLNSPFQALFVRQMFKTRQKQLNIVDQRVRLLQEVMNGIRVIKLYAFETFFKERIAALRKDELRALKKIGLVRSGMTASMSFIPVLAAVLSFITYSLSGHNLNAATIFASLQLFNTIRQPLVMLPMGWTLSSDAYVAIKRVATTLLADELAEDMQVDPSAPFAIRAFGDFAWETLGPVNGVMGRRGRGGRDYAAQKAAKKAAADAKKEAKERKKKGLGPKEEEKKENPDGDKKPFELRDIDLEVERGDLVCIVGSVGSGKSSLIQALIGEMRRVRGRVVFGGSVAYVPQQPWVQNATLRDNILFGLPMDDTKFDDVIESSALRPDIEVLPNGLDTEIGEKGINLSGGQKARVCLARAVYFDADVILLDDPLSAVDAHVAKHLTDKCLLSGPLSRKTRFLVTHHLDLLPQADHIIVMSGGMVAEQGKYVELIRSGGAFSKLVEEYGSTGAEGSHGKPIEKVAEKVAEKVEEKKPKTQGPQAVIPSMMQEEEREVGAVSWKVYGYYAKNMGVSAVPMVIFFMAMAQAANVGNSIFLGFWSEQSISAFHSEDELLLTFETQFSYRFLSLRPYMAIYASLGLAYGIFSFCSTFIIFFRCVDASYNLFNSALAGVMRSRVSWFDTTPVGRIVSRMSKDITTLDNQLPMQWNQLLTMGFSVLGTIGLVIYTYNYLGIIFVPMGIAYFTFASFYRASSREVKRLDSLLRSYIYTHFGEMQSGLASVRAYRQQKHFLDMVEDSIDVENRAAYLTIVLQRWLGVRLDFLGNLLVLGISLFGVGFRTTVQPSKLGVVLTYALSITSVFSQLVSNFASVEQDMNTAERVTHYANLPSEADLVTPNDPPPSWPEQGCIEFKDVRLRYRDGLPEVLKGVSFSTRPGEKIGVVGRTGAGKSSLLQALFRIVEVSAGSITIDGRDVSTIGLEVLRKSLAVIPQDPLLYAGTVRQNLDPISERTDQELNDALRRAGLLAPAGASEPSLERFAKFRLDATVSDEGSNFSGGERQLLALCRALVKNSRVIILDEATSSVDVETDASVQRTIQREFVNQSLLCIAHRLATIAFYDRVLVMDKGLVAEFDEPLILFDNRGIFWSMCEQAGLTRDDIVRIRRGAGRLTGTNTPVEPGSKPPTPPPSQGAYLNLPASHIQTTN